MLNWILPERGHLTTWTCTNKTNMANKSRVASAWLYSATRTEIIIVSGLLPWSCFFFQDKKGLLSDAVSMFHSFIVRAFDLLAVRIYGMADCNSKIPTTWKLFPILRVKKKKKKKERKKERKKLTLQCIVGQNLQEIKKRKSSTLPCSKRRAI